MFDEAAKNNHDSMTWLSGQRCSSGRDCDAFSFSTPPLPALCYKGGEGGASPRKSLFAAVRLSCFRNNLFSLFHGDQTLQQENFSHVRNCRNVLAMILPRSASSRTSAWSELVDAAPFGVHDFASGRPRALIQRVRDSVAVRVSLTCER